LSDTALECALQELLRVIYTRIVIASYWRITDVNWSRVGVSIRSSVTCKLREVFWLV